MIDASESSHSEFRTKRSKSALVAWYKGYIANATKTADTIVLGAERRFFFFEGADSDEIDSDARFEITEEDLLAGPGEGSGHPQVGLYLIEFWDTSGGSGTDTLIIARGGRWFEPKDKLDAADVTSPAGMMKATVGAATSMIEQLRFQGAQQTRRANEADARADRIMNEKQAIIDAMNAVKNELHLANIARDEALFQAMQSDKMTEAAIQELEALKEAGAELAPVAGAAVGALTDRVMGHFFGGGPQVDEETQTFNLVQEEICINLMRLENFHYTMQLVHAGVLPWDDVRVMIHRAWGVMAPAEIPPIDWLPVQPPTEGEPAPEPAAAPNEDAESEVH